MREKGTAILSQTPIVCHILLLVWTLSLGLSGAFVSQSPAGIESNHIYFQEMCASIESLIPQMKVRYDPTYIFLFSVLLYNSVWYHFIFSYRHWPFQMEVSYSLIMFFRGGVGWMICSPSSNVPWWKQRSVVRAAVCFYTLSTWPANSTNAVIHLGLSFYHWLVYIRFWGWGAGVVTSVSSLSLFKCHCETERLGEKNRLVGRKADRQRYRKSCDCLEVKTIIDSTRIIIKRLMLVIHKVWLDLMFGKFLYCISVQQKQVTSELSE